MEAILSNPCLALIALEWHQDTIMFSFHIFVKNDYQTCEFPVCKLYILYILCKWLSSNTSFKGAKRLAFNTGDLEWNPGPTQVSRSSAIDFMGLCQVSSLHKTWVNFGRLEENAHLFCVFLLLQQQDLPQNKNTVMDSGKNKVQNHTQWKPPILFW